MAINVAAVLVKVVAVLFSSLFLFIYLFAGANLENTYRDECFIGKNCNLFFKTNFLLLFLIGIKLIKI